MIAVLDIGENAELVRLLEEAGAEVTVTLDADTVMNADGVIIANGANFAETMATLHESKLDRFLDRRLAGGGRILGIGHGMDVLFTSAPAKPAPIAGLDEWEAELTACEVNGVVRVNPGAGSALFAGLYHNLFETFHVECESAVDHDPFASMDADGVFTKPTVTFATLNTGETIVAAIENGPLTAIKFLPEHSGPAGIHVMRTWLAAK